MPSLKDGYKVTIKSTATNINNNNKQEKQTSEYRECIDWIYAQKTAIERLEYGRNKKSVLDAIEEQTHKSRQIDNFKSDVEHVSKTASEEDKKQIQQAYSSLKDLSQKKLHCLQTMLEICNMEQYCATLGTEFDSRAVHLVAPEVREKVVSTQAQGHLPGFIATSSQDCIFGARDNWLWLVKLVQCVEIHLKNAAHYHQFFHKQDESAHWMADDLDRLHNSFELFNIKGDYDDAKRLIAELDEIITAFKQWEAKVNFSWDEALKIVPVHLRVQGISEPTPIRSLADYKTKDISIREGEDLLLIDNTGSELWKVRNNQGQESMVPALICLIPGPHRDAIESAVRMRLQLLASWTNSLKRIGKRLIVFMLKVFKPDYKEEEISLMQSIRPVDKSDLMRILSNIEDTMKTHWSEHEGFQNLQERILSLRMILEDTSEENINQDESSYRALVVQIEMLDKLMQKYRELWKMWEMYKVALETSRQPELMLIVDKWEQLQFVSREYFTKFWQADLPFDQIEKSIAGLENVLATLQLESKPKEEGSRGDGWEEETTVRTEARVNGAGSRGKVRQINEGVMHEEGVETMEEGVVETTMHGTDRATAGEEEDGDFGYAKETKTAETEQVSQSEVEESKTFVIRSVIDPRTDEEISLQEAIMIGIINPNQGLYVNPATGETIPIPVAMSQGNIKVEFTSTKRTKEKKSSVGIITVKTIREHVKHYVIKMATDTRSGEKVPLAEAVARGIVDEHHGRFTDKRRDRDMLIAEAVDAGLVEAESNGNGHDKEPEVISKTYAVRAVVDRRSKKTVSFEEAVNRGIIDRDSGAYKDTLTGDKMYVGDAIMRGFLKARPVEDTSSMDIDPKNKMVIDKTDKIRKKLVKPLGAISALRAAIRK